MADNPFADLIPKQQNPFADLIPQGAPEGVDFDAGEMVRNIPSSAAEYGKALLSPITDPKGTATGMLGLFSDVVSGNMANTIAANVTGQETDSMSQELWDVLEGRYGSKDAFKQTLMEDPVGVFADIAGMGGISRIPGLSRVSKAVEPGSVAGAAGSATANVASRATNPVKMYQSAAKFTTSPNKLNEAQRTQLIQSALDKGIMPTGKGVERVRGRIQALDNELERVIANASKSGSKIPVSAIFRPLKQLRAEKGGVKIEGGKDLEFIDKAVKKFTQHVGDKKEITIDELQAFKRDIYRKAYRSAAKNKPNTIKEDTYRQMGRGAKEAIEREVPEAGGINRELGELYDLEPHIAQSAGRIDNRNKIGLTTPLNVGAGGGIGYLSGSPEIGLAAGAVAAALNNPKVASRLAIALDRVKKGDRRWLEANRNSAEVKLALQMIDEINGQQSNQ